MKTLRISLTVFLVSGFFLSQPLALLARDIAAAKDTIDLDAVIVTASRIEEDKATTYLNIDARQVTDNHYGQDPSILLQRLSPSVLAYSDAGTEIGNYVQFRLRGMDQTRINTSLNGVPLNDMIDQGVFFSNFTDLASSVQDIQFQRGVGITNGGLSSYAGAVGFRSPDLFDDQSSASSSS